MLRSVRPTVHSWASDVETRAFLGAAFREFERRVLFAPKLEDVAEYFESYGSSQNTRITGAELQQLSGLPGLQILGLASSAITDAGMRQLAGLSHLRYLALGETDVSNVGLARLATLTSLRDLDVTKTHVTDEGVERLHKLLPTCRIERREKEKADVELPMPPAPNSGNRASNPLWPVAPADLSSSANLAARPSGFAYSVSKSAEPSTTATGLLRPEGWRWPRQWSAKVREQGRRGGSLW